MKNNYNIIGRSGLLAVALAVWSVMPVKAAVLNVDLDGNQVTDEWLPFNGSNYAGTGTFPGSSPATWSFASVGGGASLNKLGNGAGGGPYMASASIYYGGFSSATNVNGGTLSVSDSNPVANLETIVFQLEIGEAMTYDYYNDQAPLLTFTHSGGTVTGLAAGYSALISAVFNGTVTMPTGEEPLYINTYGYQWDLSSYSDISSFSISWIGVQHAQVYDIQLDQSDSFNASNTIDAQAVPEPSTYALMGLGGLALWGLRRFRRQS